MNKNSAFTLIELLIVVAIIGVLAAIAVPNFLNAQLRAKIAKAESEIRNIDVSLEMYRLDNNLYPPTHFPDGNWKYPISTRLFPLTTPIAYMSSVPVDPFLYGPPGTRINDEQLWAYDTYDYVDVWSCFEWGGLTIVTLPFRCSEWKVTSAGPDATNTYGRAYKFDVTNGLRSWGDIIRIGPRSSLPCEDEYVGK
ncbi:MAG: prepilin-type N-terminal cleavage/methylation domain-containing protein [Candidatus Omnitrophota bacterium]|jgi:type II secretion system protein G|nr:MAG: prepilin-type N-terminal cleavage/methylation domain-containing protein [Candidatus Omnitrophota bacterium]